MSAPTAITLDLERRARLGIEEAVLCQGKTPGQVADILLRADEAGRSLLLTRLGEGQREALPAALAARIDYEALSRTGFYGTVTAPAGAARVAIVSAGTSDQPVSREAARTLAYHGHAAAEIGDVGVAGLWRLMARIDEIRAFPIVIVAAGMDAALPSVVGGLVPGLVIAVPTSTGYGIADGGTTAMRAMLASCAPGVTVVNIDNGYGAACAALRALPLLAPEG
ncbi:MAG: nickel pincer cofactor biosynthesis protein LarB [Rhodospirillales bacterium]|nr:nickel pincer cofactor biosynthesis protein LarB [Rhodospirillales bacterium]MDE0379090.1 nickel pincer cofactor biosynthesis protein LarB [Rhodospirillales bacterium]